MGQVNLRLDRPAQCAMTRARVAALAPMLKMRADLFGLVLLDRTGVRLALTQAEFREYIENLTRLLTSISRARSLIRTLLIRLFSNVLPKALKCS